MMFTGRLIEDLIATVERTEARTKSAEPIAIEAVKIEPWVASTQADMGCDNMGCDSNLPLWHESGVA